MRHATTRLGGLLLVAALAVPAGAAADGGPPATEITATRQGRELVAAASRRRDPTGRVDPARLLRAWRLAPGEYLVAERLPAGLRTRTVRGAGGRTTVEVRFEVEAVAARRAAGVPGRRLAAAAPQWTWLDQACFTRISNTSGWLDSCYVIHRLTGETDGRDFYQLEQYGTVGARPGGRIYDGWLQAQAASTSSPMSWIDWSPRGSMSGSCQSVGLSVKALGVGISGSGVMCERWDIAKGTQAGQLRQTWGCGCIVPFGQPYPNTREIDHMQAISVVNGGRPRWTLSAGFGANGIS